MKRQTLLLAVSLALLAACNVQNDNVGMEEESLVKGFNTPPDEYRPETWFHINGNNLSREGLTRDMEAIQKAGIRGIQLFNKNGDPYPGVPQVEILSPEWSELIGHAAEDISTLKIIADELRGAEPSGFKKVGKGKVYWGLTVEEVLKKEAIARDVNVPEGVDIPWIHRRTKDADIYFLSNQNDHAVDASISFRTTGRSPEIWDPLTGLQNFAGVWQEKDGRTQVAISFAPHGSNIVVFRKNTHLSSWIRLEKSGQVLLDCTPGWLRIHKEDQPANGFVVEPESFTAWESGDYTLRNVDGLVKRISVTSASQSFNEPWKLAFEEGWDAPATLELPKLISLGAHSIPSVRYYSGTVTYQKEILLSDPEGRTTLNLGRVANIAEIWCNGKKAGKRWSPPFIFDLTDLVQAGTNSLEIKVTNTWRNQLIYDLQRRNTEKKTWTTNPPANKEEAPALSGLIGPVLIQTGYINPLK